MITPTPPIQTDGSCIYVRIAADWRFTVRWLIEAADAAVGPGQCPDALITAAELLVARLRSCEPIQ